METLEQIVAALNQAGIDHTKISKSTGISRNNLINIAAGRNNNPTLSTLNRLRAYFRDFKPTEILRHNDGNYLLGSRRRKGVKNV